MATSNTSAASTAASISCCHLLPARILSVSRKIASGPNFSDRSRAKDATFVLVSIRRYEMKIVGSLAGLSMLNSPLSVVRPIPGRAGPRAVYRSGIRLDAGKQRRWRRAAGGTVVVARRCNAGGCATIFLRVATSTVAHGRLDGGTGAVTPGGPGARGGGVARRGAARKRRDARGDDRRRPQRHLFRHGGGTRHARIAVL